MVSSAISENLKMSQTYRWMQSMGPFFVSEIAQDDAWNASSRAFLNG